MHIVMDVSDIVFLCNLLNQLHSWAKNQKVPNRFFKTHFLYIYVQLLMFNNLRSQTTI